MRKKAIAVAAILTAVVLASAFYFFIYPRIQSLPSGIRSGESANGYYHFTAYGESAQNAMDQAQIRAQFIETTTQNISGADSDVARINENAGSMVTVSPTTIYLVERSYDFTQRTDGYFMPLNVLAQKAWGVRGEAQPELMQYLSPNPQMNGLYVDFAHDLVGVDAGEGLDLSPLIPAYIVDQAAAIGHDYGLNSAMYQMADAVTTIGRDNNGNWWSTTVPHPTIAGEAIGVLMLENESCASAGMFQGTITMEDGELRSAAIDSRTMAPTQSDIASVTVVSSSALDAAALAQAILVAGSKNGEALLYEMANTHAILIMKDRKVWISHSLKERFSLRAEGFIVVN